MDLEERKVLHPRRLRQALTQRDKKEWWYTGAYDPALGVYVSWHFIRVNFADQVGVTVFDTKQNAPANFHKTLRLDDRQPAGQLSLNHVGRDCRVHYNGCAEEGWRFEFEGGDITADLRIHPTIPFFAKFDNTLSKNYGLLHFFQNRAHGTVQTGEGKTYVLDDALVYYDHCFGTVPRQCGWHWLAVQNESAALAALVNYGPYAQRYSQVWLGEDRRCPESRRCDWIRLEQSVSFEHQDAETFDGEWNITSSDLDLVVTPLQHFTTKAHIPPMTRFIADLHHTEGFVEAEGSVRIDGRWLEVERPMHGVMEQHYGRW